MRKADPLPYIKRAIAKGKRYYYFRTGKKDAAGKPVLAKLPDIKDPTFPAVYAAHRAARTRRESVPQELTVSGLIELYEMSPHFRALASGSQRIYRIYLKQFAALAGKAPAGKLERQDLALAVDKKAATPGAANSMLRAVNALYKWGRERGHVANTPGKDIAELPIGEHEPWPQHVLDEALKADDDRIRLVVHLLYYTALRLGDVLSLRWSDVRDGEIHVTPQKTKRTRGEVQIPMHSALVAELAKHPRTALTIVPGAKLGRPLHQNTVRPRLEAFAAERGAEVVPHGLRKNAVNALLEAGCSVAETAAISQQSLAMVEHYSKARAQGKLASAAILRWEAKR